MLYESAKCWWDVRIVNQDSLSVPGGANQTVIQTTSQRTCSKKEMSSTPAKPFRRITSLVRLRSRKETPYEAWEDDQVDNGQQSPLTANTSKSVVEFPVLAPSPTEGQERVLKPATVQPEHNLVECFYLGSTNMAGMEIKGRGCIDHPAGLIWEQSQQDQKPKRKNSWTTRHQHDSTTTTNSFKPVYVKLVTGSDALQVHDNSTGELITHFSYRKISFVGTHPKYARLFAFIAESSNPLGTLPFCHAFKCEDKVCAKRAACSLSDLFHQKIQELLQSQKIEVTAQATVIP